MNFFGPIKNYSDMQRRISFISSIDILIGLIALSNLVPQISEFFKQISLTHELDIKGLKIQAIIPIASFVIGMFFEHAIGFHNIISDVFGIRYRFDKNVIITEFLRVIGEEKNWCWLREKTAKALCARSFMSMPALQRLKLMNTLSIMH